MKECQGPGCGVKPLSEFGKDRSRPDGLKHMCRECWNSYQRAVIANRRARGLAG